MANLHLSEAYQNQNNHGGPPVLPMYKTQLKNRKGVAANSHRIYLLMLVMVVGIVTFFFISIYIGSSYLQDHIEREKWDVKIGLPNTRNLIKKWSVNYLNGIDLTSLGPPAIHNQQQQQQQHHHNSNNSTAVAFKMSTITLPAVANLTSRARHAAADLYLKGIKKFGSGSFMRSGKYANIIGSIRASSAKMMFTSSNNKETPMMSSLSAAATPSLQSSSSSGSSSSSSSTVKTIGDTTGRVSVTESNPIRITNHHSTSRDDGKAAASTTTTTTDATIHEGVHTAHEAFREALDRNSVLHSIKNRTDKDDVEEITTTAGKAITVTSTADEQQQQYQQQIRHLRTDTHTDTSVRTDTQEASPPVVYPILLHDNYVSEKDTDDDKDEQA